MISTLSPARPGPSSSSPTASPSGLISLASYRERSELQVLLYPQLNRWSRVYDARFDRFGQPSTLTMVVSGALGQGELRWEMR
jgi:hypothetical protein